MSVVFLRSAGIQGIEKTMPKKASQEGAGMGSTMRAAGAEKETKQRKYDEVAVAAKFKALNEDVTAKKTALATRQAELAAVKVAAADKAVVAEALGVSDADALLLLREHGGDAEKALRAQVGL
jgi:hypothetical protein